MGRLFLVEFDQNPENQFYCCRVCRTHIALSRDCTLRIEGIRQGRFSRVVNLVFNKPCSRTEKQVPLHCVKCNKPLGWRLVYVQAPGLVQIFILKLDDLLFWDGHLFRNADQHMHPVGNQQG